MSKRISMFHGPADDYIQVVAGEDDKKKLEGLGWRTLLVDNVRVVETIEVAAKGGHKEYLERMDSKDAIQAYVKSECGVKIDKRGSIEVVRNKALEALENGDS